MEKVSSFRPTAGEIVEVNNKSAVTTTYRAEFPGVGWVEFKVLPGGEFRICDSAGTLNLYIQDALMATGPANFKNGA